LRPYFSSRGGALGQTRISTAPYYSSQGFDIDFIFKTPLTEEDRKRINEIGHWLNQNFVIRLCAVLAYFKVFSNSIKIDFNFEGAEHDNIVRRLKNYFAHTSGRYNPNDNKHKKTIQLMHDNLWDSISAPTDGIWPIPKEPFCLENLN
jgi:hypothetical protein